MSVRVRRIRADEAEPLRDVRLRALLDAPSAFRSTHDDEASRSASMWEDRARTGSAGDAITTFVAVDGDVWVGMVTALRADEPGVVELVGMWVASEVRRRGVASRLAEAVLGWASEVGAERVELWVTRSNGSAQRFYERLGFEPTGGHVPRSDDPCKDELRMVRPVA